MTSFTLFRPGSIEAKLALMQHHCEAEALVAAIFSFSARFCRDCPNHSYFARIASSLLDESVDRYGDTRPPFWLLQAAVLVAFYQLTVSVRSRSWKRLGDCIRLSYELNLHLIDANHGPSATPTDAERWVLMEERRRAWWAVWEMDVFASTIRRLPTGIDPSLILTLLPAPDGAWFSGRYHPSCFLAEDCDLRWKQLSQSGNDSAKAWFIVINSLMRNTQRIVYPAGSAPQALTGRRLGNNHDELNIMANVLYCTVASLPDGLAYHGETLSFGSGEAENSVGSPYQADADKYAIHLMIQLCWFMIHHHKICARAPWLNGDSRGQTQTSPSVSCPHPRSQPASNNGDRNRNQTHNNHSNSNHNPFSNEENEEAIWTNYLAPSNRICQIIRNSPPLHHRHVNPFLSNTLWFAAATQCAGKVFGPESVSFNKRVAASNLLLLKMVFEKFVGFWGGAENLLGRLDRLELGLVGLMRGDNGDVSGNGNGNGSERDHGDRNRGDGEGNQDGRKSGGNTTNNPNITRTTDRTGLPPPTSLAETPLGGTALQPPVWPERWSLVPDPSTGMAVAAPHIQFLMPGQDFLAMDPMDFSPFGLEELLMASIDPCL